MKKFGCEYRHVGKTHILYLKAKNFEDARNILNEGFRTNNIDMFDFGESFSKEEKRIRLRDAYYNGNLMELILKIPLPF